MRYRLDLYEITNTTRQAVLAPVLRGELKRGLPNEDSLEFALPMYGRRGERLYDTNDDADGSEGVVLTPQKWVRLVDLDLATSRSYVIREITKARDLDGQAVLTLKCEGYAFKFMDKIVPLTTDFAGVTATIFLTQILAGTGLTVGTNQIPTTEKRTVHIEYPNVVEALNVITDTWDETAGGVKKRFFWRINENNTVDILREDTYGSTLTPKFTAKRNILSLNKEMSSRKMVNRIYASTSDGGGLIESSRTWYFDQIQSSDLTTVGNTDTLTLNGYGDTSNKLAARSYVIPRIYTESVWTANGNADFTIVAELRRASDSAVRARAEKVVRHTHTSGGGTEASYVGDMVLPVLENTDADQWFLKFEAFTVNAGTVTSKLIKTFELHYWTAPNVNYIDGANQGTYGIIEGGFKDETLSLNAHNLISDKKVCTGTRGSPTVTSYEINSDFTGTYTSGVCAGWTTSGAGLTAAENTDSAFVIHGTKSQKATATLNAKGILTAANTRFPIRSAFSYYFSFTTYVDTGSLRFRLVAYSSGNIDLSYDVKGKGWLEVSGFVDKISAGIPSKEEDYELQFLGIREGTTDPVFYLDSVMFCIAGDRRPFTRKSIADDLRTKALDAVGLNESPAKTFSLDMADLGETEPNLNSAERFVPGDYIKIDDKTLNVSATLRVQQKTTDLINPEKSRVEIELLPLKTSDVLFKALGRPELALQRS